MADPSSKRDYEHWPSHFQPTDDDGDERDCHECDYYDSGKHDNKWPYCWLLCRLLSGNDYPHPDDCPLPAATPERGII